MPASRLSVMHVVLSLDGGGLERVVLDLTREGLNMGQVVSVLCVEKPGLLAPEVAALGANLFCAHKGPGLRFSVLKPIRSIIDQVRPDVVHSHQIGALLYLAPLGRRHMPVLVHTTHNNQFVRCRTLHETVSLEAMLALAARRADRLFAVSVDSERGLLRSRVLDGQKIFTVTNGIDLSRFQPCQARLATRSSLGIPPEALVIGTVGRLNTVKRQDILMDAFARLGPEFNSSHLVIVGDGPLMAQLRSQAEALGIADRVHLPGFCHEVERFLSAFDIFALTSRIEGMPLAVLEAEAMALPVIASKVGGVEEISNGGRSILLYDFDDAGALLHGLRKLGSDAALRRELGASARQYVRSDFSSARMARDYLRHYEELMAERAIRR